MGQKVPQPKTGREHISNARSELKQYCAHRTEMLGAKDEASGKINKDDKLMGVSDLTETLAQRSSLGYAVMNSVRELICNQRHYLGVGTSDAVLNDYIHRVREPMAMAILDEIEKGLK